ncbi:MAG TPA: hypothetical protein DET40_11865 [Lentisphaeria bacterium]|nr:MAG: hypothetical protein A2X45_05995 [Lentisphaerae bacterium GWF2_50_93]HCE44235.1 hypothetical protein [Lentisphaeria bacterium]
MLIPCQKDGCSKIFRESEGLKHRRDLDSVGLPDFKCPFCGEEFSGNREKLKKIQAILRKKLNVQLKTKV